MRPELSALLVAVLLLFIVSCTSTATSSERSLQIACSTYADTLDVLATRNRLGLLSADAQDRVDRIDSVAGPICDGSVPIEPRTALATVEESLVLLIEARRITDGNQ